MTALADHCAWLFNELKTPNIQKEICQCGTEKVIARSRDRKRLRAVLLSYVFLDQLIYTHHNYAHDAFKQTFVGPILRAHSSVGYASPSWLVFSNHGFDAKADWSIVTEVFLDFMSNGLTWLESQRLVMPEDYWQIVMMEINQEFEPDHSVKFIQVLSAKIPQLESLKA